MKFAQKKKERDFRETRSFSAQEMQERGGRPQLWGNCWEEIPLRAPAAEKANCKGNGIF